MIVIVVRIVLIVTIVILLVIIAATRQDKTRQEAHRDVMPRLYVCIVTCLHVYYYWYYYYYCLLVIIILLLLLFIFFFFWLLLLRAERFAIAELAMPWAGPVSLARRGSREFHSEQMQRVGPSVAFAALLALLGLCREWATDNRRTDRLHGPRGTEQANHQASSATVRAATTAQTTTVMLTPSPMLTHTNSQWRWHWHRHGHGHRH